MEMIDIQSIKQRFGIIGNDPALNRAIEVAVQVAATDLTVFITGESGTGKDVFPQIIHQNSARKHGPYFAINCGAIPEGTIDSELFGHEKGSFTGAYDTRKGYFEVADGGTLFLDEVGELPLATQARLLRVLENGEFIKVGSSKIQKTNVRVVAATNVDIPMAIEKGRFREDLYYRLNTVPIHIPALRERKDDIKLLFRKFASDFAEKYHIPAVTLTPEALTMLENYRWDGNIRQLKNVTEQISIIETERVITPEILKNYLPEQTALPAIFKDESKADSISERDLLYKVLFDMKKDIAELRKTVDELTAGQIPTTTQIATPIKATVINSTNNTDLVEYENTQDAEVEYLQEKHVVDNLSLQDKENEVIIKALQKHNGKRKDAAKELGISERTLYRKIKEYNINM
ncbi:MAG: sigma-54-dependent Fis family transcriptional regulator [Bacteroidales bacterium]|nr:sigma-54-dependent Fis family transcriptional regulator [Bacteroidales bacterium]